jgi:HSP20 family protein
LPGVDEDEIKIDFENGRLCIEGVREFDHDNFDAEEFSVIDRPYGSYDLSILLPAGSNANLARAKYKRGVLRLQIPRQGEEAT